MEMTIKITLKDYGVRKDRRDKAVHQLRELEKAILKNFSVPVSLEIKHKRSPGFQYPLDQELHGDLSFSVCGRYVPEAIELLALLVAEKNMREVGRKVRKLKKERELELNHLRF